MLPLLSGLIGLWLALAGIAIIGVAIVLVVFWGGLYAALKVAQRVLGGDG